MGLHDSGMRISTPSGAVGGGSKQFVVAAGIRMLFSEHDGKCFIDAEEVGPEMFKKRLEEWTQLEKDEERNNTRMLFQHLEEIWLPKLVRGEGLVHKFVEQPELEQHGNRRRKYRLYTSRHVYAISAVLKADGGTYLGCVMSDRMPEAGEEYTRGADLPDGKFNHNTWLAILYAIIGHELVPLFVRPEPVEETKEDETSG